MSNIVSIDFETRSATDIKLGVERYSKDPECEVLMLAYRMPADVEPVVWHRGPHLTDNEVTPAPLLEHVAAGGLIRAWNAPFEWHIWNNVCVPKYGWPPLKLEQCVDTMAQAAAQNLPQALGRCAVAMGLPSDKQKDTRGKYLIQRLCVPHPPTKTRSSKWVEDPELFNEMVAYCAQDVIVEEAIARKLRPLSPFEQDVWIATQRVNLRGVPVALDEARNIHEVVELEKERLNRELRAVTGRRVLKATDRHGLLEWVNSNLQPGLEPIDFRDPVENDEDRPGHEEPLADMRADTVEAVLKRDGLTAHVRRALEIRAAVVQTSTAKYAKLLKITADDGTIKNMFVYHGAGTGRWASRGGFNVQNITRPTLLVDEKKGLDDIANAHEILGSGKHTEALLLWGDRTMDAAVSCLRGVLKAPEGYEFIDADYSSVENRVGVWLAGQQDKVDMFAKGLDEYKVFASKSLYRVPYEQVTKDMRQMSKSAVLGCLFGQGAQGLIDYAKGYGVTLTPERSKEVVDAYRAEYAQVKALWYACGDAAINAVRSPGQWFEAGDKLELICHRNFLWMKLPSGRLISWSRPEVEMQEAPWMEKVFTRELDADGNQVVVEAPAIRPVVTVESIDTYTRQFCRHKLIGSSIFQSAVQGTARDIIAQGMMNVEAAGYPVVLMAHDELMALVPEGTKDPEEFGRLMCRPADWFKDLPLSYEAWRGKRFKK
jgi:DNA polymerase